MDALRADSTLQSGKYRIIKKLGQGGFGITYLAENTLLLGKVAIKEFFFKDYCERDDSTSCVTIPKSGNREIVDRFKLKFVKEARTIFRLNHPNIVRIHDVFEENDTAYYVMDYIEGESLGDMVKRRGAIPEAEALGYVKDVASALEYIHSKNINHLDIKPGNLMRRKEDGRVLVIDFGVAKQYDAVTSEGTTTTPVCISPGYSPVEQYSKNDVQTFSPQSDVYALAATLFKLLTGNTPLEATKIQYMGLPVAELQEKHISLPVISAIAMAMKGRRERTQSVAEFISNLNGDDTVVIAGSTEVKPKRHETERKATKTFQVGGVSFDMVWVEGGTFRMGATSEQGSTWDYEKPVHSVTLSGYYIGKTEVTQALWEAVMGSNPSYFKGDDQPVEQVSWDDCQVFIRKLNALTGQNFRLPTEAEWEFACRGGNNSRGFKYSGSDNIDNVAWYDGNSGGKTHPVATKSPNELGIYDMSGNVEEWCADWYGNYSSGAQTNPKGPYDGSDRVGRGSNWLICAWYCRSSNRSRFDPASRYINLGLRLSLTPLSDVTEAAGYDVTFSCNVPSALLFIDGVPNGIASGTRFLKTGNHIIKVTADKYEDYSGSFVVNSLSRRVSITLQEVQDAIYKPKLKTFKVKGVSFDMVEVRGGTFRMGATSEQGNDASFLSEKPVHSVTLSGYYIGKTLVTQALWKAVMGSNPSTYKGDNLPVENVFWNDCQEFIRKLNALTGQNFRLPTEAEWEFACRGGNNSRGYKYSGSDCIDDVAWYDDNSGRKTWFGGISGQKTHPVATKSPNELGIYDMSGNVEEWCSDWEGDYSSDAQTNPKGSYYGSYRVNRGGSWLGQATDCRSSYRSRGHPDCRSSTLGLRLAL